MNIDININANICPKNDFYLQWCYLYWWQVKINFELMLKQAMCELVKIDGDVE